MDHETLVRLFDQVYNEADWGGPNYDAELEKFLAMAERARRENVRDAKGQ